MWIQMALENQRQQRRERLWRRLDRIGDILLSLCTIGVAVIVGLGLLAYAIKFLK